MFAQRQPVEPQQDRPLLEALLARLRELFAQPGAPAPQPGTRAGVLGAPSPVSPLQDALEQRDLRGGFGRQAWGNVMQAPADTYGRFGQGELY